MWRAERNHFLLVLLITHYITRNVICVLSRDNKNNNFIYSFDFNLDNSDNSESYKVDLRISRMLYKGRAQSGAKQSHCDFGGRYCDMRLQYNKEMDRRLINLIQYVYSSRNTDKLKTYPNKCKS